MFPGSTVSQLCFALCFTAATTLGTACGYKDPINIDFAGTDEQFAIAQQAADEWNNTCNRDLVRVYRGAGEGVAMYGQIGELDGNGVSCAGLTHIVNGNATYIIFREDTNNPFMPVFAHEFGHALGLKHTVDGLMKPTAGASLVGLDGHLKPGAISPEECVDALY